MRFGAFAVVAICGSLPLLPSQSVSNSQDAARSVHRTARQVQDELLRIDEFLQQASRPPNTRDLLVAASDSQGKVVSDIDKLLDQLHEFCCTCPGGT